MEASNQLRSTAGLLRGLLESFLRDYLPEGQGGFETKEQADANVEFRNRLAQDDGWRTIKRLALVIQSSVNQLDESIKQTGLKTPKAPSGKLLLPPVEADSLIRNQSSERKLRRSQFRGKKWSPRKIQRSFPEGRGGHFFRGRGRGGPGRK